MLALANKLTLSTQPIYRFVNKYSIDFDGVDDCIVTDGADTVAQPTTYSFWCKSSTTGQNKGVFGHGQDRQGGFHFNWTSGLPLLYLGTDYYKHWNDNSAQDDGEWHHWVVYADPNDITNSKLYVDGVLQTVNTTVSTGSATAYTESLTIGGDQAVGGNYFEGQIDEFAVYDRELTQDEITRMYNTYYSPNRVANGNFAQIGNEEVTNGDFSQEGSEQITNGNFSDGQNNWSFGTGWSIIDGKATVVNQTGWLTTTGAPILANKQIKLQFDVVLDGGTLRVKNNTNDFDETFNTVGSYTITRYYSTGGSASNLQFPNYGSGFSGSIDNVSVKEVGQDWTFGTGWGMGDGKAVADTSNNTNGLLQTNIITSGKFYKATFEVLDYQSGSVRINLGGAGLTGVGDLASSNGIYTQYINSDGIDLYIQGRSSFVGSIDNLSVKEVGQHWTFGSSWSTNGTEATFTTGSGTVIESPIGLIGNRTYRVSCVVTGSPLTLYMGTNTVGISVPLGTYNANLVTASNTNGTIGFLNNGGGASGTLDNIVVQELKHDATNLMLNAGAYQSANPLITSTKSMEFDGSDNFLKVEDSANLRGMAALTVCCWVKCDSKNDYAKILDYSSTSGNSQRKYRIQFNNATDQKLQFLIANTSDSTSVTTTTNAFPTDRWVHIVGTFDNSLSSNRQNLYIDGVLEQTATAFTETINNDDSGFLSFGENTYGSNNFDGQITEAGVYNRALTSLEVASLYNQGMPTNLLVNRNNYQSGNPTVFNTKQVDFDGSDDYMIAKSTLGSFTGSVSFWVNRDNNTGTFPYIADFRELGNDSNGTGYIHFQTNLDTLIASSGTIYVDNVATSTVPTDGSWHHVVVTGITLNITANILFGVRASSQHYLNGKLSQVGLWNSTLTADEVSSLYNHGLPIDLTTNQAAYESSSNLVGYWRMGSGTLDSYPLIADQTNATLGSNLVLNGTFETAYTGDEWLAFSTPTTLERSTNQAYEGSYSLRIAGSDGKGVQASATQFTGDYTVGDVVKITAYVYPITSPNNRIKTGVSNSDRSPFILFTGLTLNQWNKVEYYVTISTASNNYISFLNSGTGEFYLDNVSAKIVQGNPAIMTNQTSSDIENGSPYADLVQNGDFATGDFTSWANNTSGNASIVNNQCVFTNASSGNNIQQTPPIVIGKTYISTFDIISITQGAFKIYADSGGGKSDVGKYSFTWTATDTNWYVRASGTTSGVIDNVTLEEVNTGLQGYWKMGDGTNDEYPVIYDQVDPTLGSDLVTGVNSATTVAGAYTDVATNWSATIGDILAVTFTLGGNYRLKVWGWTYYSVINSSIEYNTGTHTAYITVSQTVTSANASLRFNNLQTSTVGGTISNITVKKVNGNLAYMTNMVEGNITNQYPLTKIRNYYRMGDGILDGYPIIQDQTSPNLAHIPTTNLVTYSEDFTDSSWNLDGSQLNLTRTPNAALSPSGNNDATKLIANNITKTPSTAYIGVTTSASTPYTTSIFAKKGEYDYLVSGTGAYAGGYYAVFNLSNGTVSKQPTASDTNASIEDYGNGWYRCLVNTTNAGGLELLFISPSVDGTITTLYNSTTSGIYIWGAQLEEQSQATAYIKSDGIAAVRKASTTNLITYSEDFSTFDQIQDITLTADATTSPTGTSNATKFTSSAASGSKVRDNISVVSGTTYTFSVYCKNIDATLIKLLLYDGVTSFNNVVTSEVSTTEWTRVSLTFTAGNTSSSGQVQIARDLPSGESAFFWGAQLEEQTQAETYAKTTGLPVTIDLFTENNYGTMTNMSASDIIEDTPNN